MKYLYLSLFAIGLLTSCGGSGDDSSSEETTEEFTPPTCPTSTITVTDYSYNSQTDSVDMNDFSFEVKGSAGYYDDGRLRMFIGDVENDSDMDEYDYLDACHVCVQISLDNAAVGDFNVLDSHTPVQPYVDGGSMAYFGSSSAFPDGEASGNINISEISEEWICGSIDMVGYHGGQVNGDFSVKLRPK